MRAMMDEFVELVGQHEIDDALKSDEVDAASGGRIEGCDEAIPTGIAADGYIIPKSAVTYFQRNLFRDLNDG